jgi:hypothetical protein
MANFMDAVIAGQYLEHKYKEPEHKDFPLPDEDFASEWDAWLEGRDKGFPEEVRALLSGGELTKVWKVWKVWIEKTPAGGIPVVYMEDRRTFERLTAVLSAEDDSRTLPASVNAFTIPAKHPLLRGHRVICLAKAGYSALSGKDAGIEEDEWVEKSAVIRLSHECCHYFTLRVLGGMKNHALDEVVADCVGQLAAFGRYDASLQRKFFGLGNLGNPENMENTENKNCIAPGGRLGFYVKTLPEGAVPLVCRKVNEALDGLEAYLKNNAEMTKASRGPDLIMKLAALGLSGMAELG